jgi:hypothetical protein
MRVAGIRHRWVMLQRSWPHWRSPTVAAVRGVPWWGVISSAAAPVLLVAAWTVAAALQPRSYDAVGGTVSALAAEGAAARWVMTLAFAVAGACEIMTGLVLRPAASPGRLILMAGGAAGVLVAANPQHAGGSLTHAVWAVLGFTALATWPGGAWRRGPSVPWALRPAVSASAAAILLGLLAWFGLELVTGAGHVGLAERVMGLAQAIWPLAVVLSCRLSQHCTWTPPAGPASSGTLGAQAAAPRPFAPGHPGTAITCGVPVFHPGAPALPVKQHRPANQRDRQRRRPELPRREPRARRSDTLRRRGLSHDHPRSSHHSQANTTADGALRAWQRVTRQQGQGQEPPSKGC